MSSWNNSKGPVPPRWLHCPRKAVKLIQNKFLAFKTPLSSAFDDQVPEECRFSVDMLLSSLKSQKVKLGLWIDLTNTTRFYDKKAIEMHGCRYLKLQCRGHGETPSEEQTRTFVQVCRNFICHNPLEIIGIHCTHGFNRTGFLIISYLVEIDGSSVDAALVEFATARPPGIYKADYIQELYRRYDDVDDAPPPPARPAWCLEYDDADVEDQDESPSVKNPNYVQVSHTKRRKREFNNKNPTFMAGVPGVKPILEQEHKQRIQKRVQEICSWESTGFPGSQPVSMDMENIRLLREKPYRVSWKADGTRYMMFIHGNKEVYFVDRDNSIFQVDGLSFPHPKNKSKALRDTLLDGEMVIDIFEGKQYPRYLVYDVIMFDGEDVSKLPFFPDRCDIIEAKILHPRQSAIKKGEIRRDKEPFSVRLKHFWAVTLAHDLLSEKFAKQLGHEPDGLIFQPAKEPYCTGLSEEVLKWKPLSLNSVDFRLKIVTESGVGILPKKIGQLFVGGADLPFGTIKYTKQLKDLNNSIVEYRTVLLWCAKDLTIKEKKSLRVNVEYDHATLVRWSPDGKAFIIHKAVANNIEVYRITKHLRSATKALEFPNRHTEDVIGMDIACTGKYIITCSKANDLVVWDLKGQPLATVEMYLGSTYRARISPCGRFIAASGFTPDVNVWEVVFTKSGEFKQVEKAFDLAGHSSGILDFNFNADTSHTATVSKDGTYRLYNTKIEFEKGEDPHVIMTGTWDIASTASIVLSPNAEVLVIAHGSSLSFYSMITGTLDTTIDDIFLGPIICLAFDAIGEHILVAGDKHIKIFRNITGYRAAIESARRKLQQRLTSATKERLEKLIADNTSLLKGLGERCPE
ncbi:hypothetical protein KM043_009082 [Ampulex compressa]|nr:hypothetical protein KM043_009082 [Ampulex compressa]